MESEFPPSPVTTPKFDTTVIDTLAGLEKEAFISELKKTPEERGKQIDAVAKDVLNRTLEERVALHTKTRDIRAKYEAGHWGVTRALLFVLSKLGISTRSLIIQKADNLRHMIETPYVGKDLTQLSNDYKTTKKKPDSPEARAVKMFTSIMPDLKEREIEEAFKGDDPDLIQALIDGGKLKVNQLRKDGTSWLTYAILKEKFGVAHALLQNKADVNLRHSNACTPLIAAVFLGNKKLVESLLAKGASALPASRLPSQTDESPTTALEFAVLYSQPELAVILLVNIPRPPVDLMRKALITAIQQRKHDAAKALYKKGLEHVVYETVTGNDGQKSRIPTLPVLNDLFGWTKAGGVFLRLMPKDEVGIWVEVGECLRLFLDEPDHLAEVIKTVRSAIMDDDTPKPLNFIAFVARACRDDQVRQQIPVDDIYSALTALTPEMESIWEEMRIADTKTGALRTVYQKAPVARYHQIEECVPILLAALHGRDPWLFNQYLQQAKRDGILNAIISKRMNLDQMLVKAILESPQARAFEDYSWYPAQNR